ncbi:MAG: 3-deoxy-D-manno-octulosonic acid transferase [Chitinophagaceae bacterium]
MGLFLYHFFLIIYKAAVSIAAPFNHKAKKWLNGRKNIWEDLRIVTDERMYGKADTKIRSKIIWIHCASLGEFEQGRPVIERLRTQYPDDRLLLTFFSPSGYEIRKDFSGVDWVFYLPLDGPKNASRFLNQLNPSLVIFVKYEFWYYYLKEIKQRKIPLLLISALFRKNAIFFRWYGGLQRKMLSFFDHLFVQNEESKKLLETVGMEAMASVSGDTRFDRVIEISEKSEPILAIELFTGNNKIIVAGSTWSKDEELLQKSLSKIIEPALKLIIAPHETNEEHIRQIQRLFPDSILFSDLLSGMQQPTDVGSISMAGFYTLIIDNVGMLSRLYKYGHITYVGGGFGKGIHNTLEAAVYGKPVLFGPVYNKFREAIDLVNSGGAISIRDENECIAAIQKYLHDDSVYSASCEKSRAYVYANRGATEKILKFIQENRLLTN